MGRMVVRNVQSSWTLAAKAATSTLNVGRLVGDETRVVHLEHGGAGAGGHNDIIAIGEGADSLKGEGFGRGAVAGVIGGLAAAGLAFRNDHFAAGCFDQACGSKADGRPHEIDEAGHEKTGAGGLHDFALQGARFTSNR